MKTKIHRINRRRFTEMFADYSQDELGDRINEPGGFLDVYGDTLATPAGWTEERAYAEMYRRFWDAYVAHLGCDTLEDMEGFVEFHYNLENATVSLVREYADQTIYEVEFDDDRTVPAGRDRKRLHVAGQGVFEEIVFEPLVKERIKTYVLTLSKTFLKGHPKEGQETDFETQFLYGVHARPPYPGPVKIHTIRENYELWKRRIDEVNEGKAVLSVRQWTGRPYRSKQTELFRFDKDSGIGVEKLTLGKGGPDSKIWPIDEVNGETVVGKPFSVEMLADNDGLSLEDWKAWFRTEENLFREPMAIIHFTEFRYYMLKEGSL